MSLGIKFGLSFVLLLFYSEAYLWCTQSKRRNSFCRAYSFQFPLICTSVEHGNVKWSYYFRKINEKLIPHGFSKKSEKMWFFDSLGYFGHFLTGSRRRPKNFKFLYFSEFWAEVSLKMYMLQFALELITKWNWGMDESESIFESILFICKKVVIKWVMISVVKVQNEQNVILMTFIVINAKNCFFTRNWLFVSKTLVKNSISTTTCLEIKVVVF